MSQAFSRSVWRVASQYVLPRSLLVDCAHGARTSLFVPAMTLRTTTPLRAEPKKKKKADPRREQLMRERLKKKVKKLEKVAPEFIPIEDFITPVKYMDETRTRSAPVISFEESERRALLLKEWSRYKQEQHKAEKNAIESALKAQREALEELRRSSQELYLAAIKPDVSLFPFTHKGPAYTPPKPKYEAPEGKYHDITKVYTQ